MVAFLIDYVKKKARIYIKNNYYKQYHDDQLAPNFEHTIKLINNIQNLKLRSKTYTLITSPNEVFLIKQWWVEDDA